MEPHLKQRSKTMPEETCLKTQPDDSIGESLRGFIKEDLDKLRKELMKPVSFMPTDEYNRLKSIEKEVKNLLKHSPVFFDVQTSWERCRFCHNILEKHPHKDSCPWKCLEEAYTKLPSYTENLV